METIGGDEDDEWMVRYLYVMWADRWQPPVTSTDLQWPLHFTSCQQNI